MMKKFIGLQLALFFISAGMLYLYASNLFGAENKLMDAKKSYWVWQAVNELEDSWHKVEPGSSDKIVVSVVPLEQS